MSDDAWAHQIQLERQHYEQFYPANCGHSTERKERAMKTSDMIQSKFLKKEDFDTPKVLTIKDCSLEEVGQGDTRWVLFFKEAQKGLVLNVTKIRQLEAAYGDDSDGWISQRVKLSHDPNVSFQGKIVGGIALQTPKAAKPVAPPPPAVHGESDFGDDDIPF